MRLVGEPLPDAFRRFRGVGGGGVDRNLRLDGWSGGHWLRFWVSGGWGWRRRRFGRGLFEFLRIKANFLQLTFFL